MVSFICRLFITKNIDKLLTIKGFKRNIRSNEYVTLFSSGTMGTKIFNGKSDRFHGITVHSDKETCQDTEFEIKLEDSLKIWKMNGNRGIWFNIHLKQSSWVPILAQKGFKFHHAKEDYVMMYLWLPVTENCNIPPFAHTMVGAGAVVVNDKNQVLVVQEKYKILGRPFWKLPGGYLEPGENIVDAAIREVYEETNISTEFQSILTIRHAHDAMYKCSDIYAVVSLRPLNEDIQKCEKEIDDCKWMDIDEYLTHPNIHELNKFQLQKFLEYNKSNIKINCYHGVHEILKKPYTVYSITRKEQNCMQNDVEDFKTMKTKEEHNTDNS